MDRKALLNKNSKFWKLIFTLTTWPSYFYSLYLAKKYPLEQYRKYFENRDVYCVGAGPSLDAVNIKCIKNSTILLLNGAFKSYKCFDKSNEIIWFSVDVNVIIDIKEQLPKTLKKMMSFQAFNKALFCSGLLQQGDAFIMPASRLYFNYKILPVMGSKRVDVKDALLGQRTDKSITLIPFTVMLNAILISALFRAKKIVLLGFDVSHFGDAGSGGKYSNMSATKTPKKRSLSVNFYKIQDFLQKFCDELSQHDIEIYNCSPFTKEKVLPKIYSLC